MTTPNTLFRKKPVEVEAFQLPAAGVDVPDAFHEWCERVGFSNFESGRDETLLITTPEGVMEAQPGDWIICGVMGEFYPCKPEVFAATYVPAASGTPAAEWRARGEADPHAGHYDGERSKLCMGHLTDDEVANGAFLNYNAPLNLQGIVAGTHYSPIAWMTAAKDRIRWLSRSLEKAIAMARPAPVQPSMGLDEAFSVARSALCRSIDIPGTRAVLDVLRERVDIAMAAIGTNAGEAASVKFEWPKLEKPARAGGGVFRAGVSSRFVVEAAQRLYEASEIDRNRTPEEMQDDERKRRSLWDMIHGSPYPPAAVHGQSASTEVPRAAVERIVHLKASRSMRCYIAGPMTGLPEFNFPAFNAKAADLRAQGWHVENPAEHGHVEGADWGDYLRYDISRIATCEAIFLLPGWSKSTGASLEVHIARTLDMKVCLCEGAESPFATPPAAIPAAPREALMPGRMEVESWRRSLLTWREASAAELIENTAGLKQCLSNAARLLLDHPALAQPVPVQSIDINGKPATAHSLLAALLDIHDDAEKYAPENRSYVEEAWPDILKAAREFLAAPVQQCPNCKGTYSPTAFDPEWKGRCECTDPAQAAPVQQEADAAPAADGPPLEGLAHFHYRLEAASGYEQEGVYNNITADGFGRVIAALEGARNDGRAELETTQSEGGA